MNPRQILRILIAMILAMTASGYASPISLSGTIFDKDNKPMAGVVVSLALAGLADTTGADGKWTVAGAQGVRILPRTVQPMAKWSGRNLHLDLTAPALVQMDAFDVRGARLGRVAQLMVDAGSHEIPVTSSASARGAHWLLLTVDGKRQVLATGGRVKIAQQPLPGALGRAMADSVEQIIYTLQGQLISADTVRILIQSGLEKWVQEFSVSGNVLSDPRVTVDSVFAWFDGGRMTGMRRARLGYNKANLAYSGRLYTVKSFTDVFNFRVWLNVMGNGNRKTGISDTTDFSSDFGDINFIPKFNIANAIPAGTITGPVTGLVNTDFEYAATFTRNDEKIAHYEWDLGDGKGFKAGAIKQTAKWLQPGSYTVQARLTDIDSNLTILTKTVNITNQAAVVAGIRDTIITPNDIVVFSINAVDTDGVAKVMWNFGDGGVDSTFSALTHSVSHKYPGTDSVKPGETRVYNLTVTVVDSLGNPTNQIVKISVNNDIPIVSVRDTVGQPDSMITLHANTFDRGSIVKVEWSTDGNTFKSSGKDTAFRMPNTKTKNYPIYVRVTDDDGNISKTDTLRVIVDDIFTDARDGQRYRLVTIGTQTWMAQNLNYKIDSSWWYNNSADSGVKHGRLYTWASALGLHDSCNTMSCENQVEQQHQGVCPVGWHVPSKADWGLLSITTTGFDSVQLLIPKISADGEDGFGFSLLASGLRMNIGFYPGREYWTSTSAGGGYDYSYKERGAVNVGSSYGDIFSTKRSALSVRCLQNSISATLRDTVVELGAKVALRIRAKGTAGSPITKYEWSINGGSFSSGGADTTITVPTVQALKYPVVVRVTDQLGNVSEFDTASIGIFQFVDDARDSQRYRVVSIGDQTWMAQNLNYNVDSSWWYNNNADSGVKYGRYYSWASAMGMNDSCNAKSCVELIKHDHQGVCPSGWRIPNVNDWEALISFSGGVINAGVQLLSDKWKVGTAAGKDEYGFSLIPSGYRSNSGDFSNTVGVSGFWWSQSNNQTLPTSASSFWFVLNSGKIASMQYYKSAGCSIRCIKI